jgi:hypothetical protein
MTRAWRWTCITGFVLFALGLGAPPPAAAQSTQTLEGEIVDPAAYLKEGARGLSTVDQTYEAVDGGQTLAFLEDQTGALYLLLAEAAGEDPNELAYDYVNQKVKLTGTVHERGGLKGVVVVSIELVQPPAEAQNTPTY